MRAHGVTARGRTAVTTIVVALLVGTLASLAGAAMTDVNIGEPLGFERGADGVITQVLPVTTSTTVSAGPTGGSPSCLGPGGTIVLAGTQTGQYRNVALPTGARVDARRASWPAVGSWPVHIGGAAGACWSGGVITGAYPAATTWDELHDTGAVNVSGPGAIVEGIRIHNYGDGLRAIEGGAGFTFRGAHLSYIRDDCIENDYLYSGLVEDSFLDGCYVAFSARTHSGNSTVSGAGNTWAIRGSLIRLQPMPTVYSGPAPGHGGFFKWDADSSRAVRLSLHNNVFRADQDGNHTGLGIPSTLTDCSNNVVVWLGSGPYPDPLPSCFTVTTDRGVWDTAVAAWTARHP